MSLKQLILLALLASSLYYGIRPFIYFSLALLSFAAGFMTFLPDRRWKSQKSYSCLSRGLIKVDENVMTTNLKRVTYSVSGCNELDIVIDQILDHVMQDYVKSWYGPLTNESEFLQNVHFGLANLLSEVSKKFQAINWIPFLIDGVPNTVIDHLRIYRKTLERLHASKQTGHGHYGVFFDIEAEKEEHFCREGICTRPEEELKHLKRLTEVILYATMPSDDFAVPAYRLLLRDVIVNGILLPAINILADPDFVNRTIINLCNESACTSPYFIHSLRMSHNVPELEAVMDSIIKFSDRLRGHDSGGEDDALIKAQLSSLQFISKLCTSRIELLKSRPSPKPMPPSVEDSVPICDLSFDSVMNNDIAVANFLDFLTSLNEQSLFSLYLNCVAFRANAESLSTEVSTNSPSNSDDKRTHEDMTSEQALEESLSSSPAVDFKLGSPSLDAEGVAEARSSPGSDEAEFFNFNSPPTSSEESGAAVPQDLRAFGVSLCNLILRDLPLIPEETVQKCLRTLTSSSALDPYVFSEVEDELVRILSGDRCFGAFKRSPFYTRALNEMDLSTENNSLSMSVRSQKEGISPSSSMRRLRRNSEEVEHPDVTADDAAMGGVQHSMSTVSSPQSSLTGQTNPPSSLTVSQPAGVHADTYSVSITDSAMTSEGYTVYTLEVICTSAVTGRRSSWKINRRFSQFDDLNSLIIDQCGRIPYLRLPSKKALSNLNPEFIEKRRRDLEEYIQSLCSVDASGRYPKLHEILFNFLHQENWGRKKSLPSGVASIVNPLKVVGSAVLSVPDTLIGGVSRIFNRNTNSTASRGRTVKLFPSDPFVASMDQVESENIPSRILFVLVDEVFSLQKKNTIFRRGILGILHNIVQTFFGDIVNRKIIEKANYLISAGQMATYAAMLRDVLWPNGSANVNTSDAAAAVRDSATKLRTRVLCRTVMLGSVSEELAQYLGSETTREGVQRVFMLLQQPCLNRRLVYRLLEGVLRLVLRDHADQLNEIYNEDLCPHLSGRICSLHTST